MADEFKSDGSEFGRELLRLWRFNSGDNECDEDSAPAAAFSSPPPSPGGSVIRLFFGAEPADGDGASPRSV